MTHQLHSTVLSVLLVSLFLSIPCTSQATCIVQDEDCFNGIDDNADGLVDCDDPQCQPGYFTDSGQLIGNSESQSVAFGDVNGDGHPDAFVANNNSKPNRVWLNNGSGTFLDSGQLRGSSNSTDVNLEDLDGDGDLDAWVTNGDGQPNRVWINQGENQGGTPGQFLDSGQTLGSSNSRGVDLGDLDQDGDLDAFVANDVDQPNTVWINQGGNQPGPPGQFLGTVQELGTSASFDVALGDINNDGHLDAVVANAAFAPNRLWLGNGTGQFAISTQSLGFANSRSVVVEDLDNDGDLDVVVVNYQQPNIAYFNTGGLLNSSQQLGAGRSWGVDVGDLNGDGLPDVFIANYDEPHRVWFNEGDGTLSDSGQNLGQAISSAVALVDVDSDGDLDAFVTNMQANHIWLNNLMEACGSDADGDGILNECDVDEAGGPDCDGNGVKDSCDPDQNGNGIPDVCDVPIFRRGDVNTDSLVDISDPVMLISYLLNVVDVSCVDAADVNDNGNVNIVDLVHLLLAIFQGAPEIPAPGPLNCGPDPIDDALDCVNYDGC